VAENDRQAAGLCGDELQDGDDQYACVLPSGHSGWHLDLFRMVDEPGHRLPCELRWAPATIALDDLLRVRVVAARDS